MPLLALVLATASLVERVDVEVRLPHGKGTVVQKNVRANQRLTVKGPTSEARRP